MSEAAGIAIADKIGVACCHSQECDCASIALQFVDPTGKVFAVAPITAEIAREVALGLLKAANSLVPVS